MKSANWQIVHYIISDEQLLGQNRTTVLCNFYLFVSGPSSSTTPVDAKTAMISAVILLSHLLCCLAEVQRECPATERCLPQNNCTEFLEKKEKFEVSKDQKLLTELRSQVCDSAEKKVCCEKSVDSGQPLSTRSTEPLKKETEEPLTTGQCGQAQIVPANVRLRD